MMDFMIPVVMLIAYNAGEWMSTNLKTLILPVFSSFILERFPGSEALADGQQNHKVCLE